MAERFTLADLGDYYLGPDGKIWRLVVFTDQPTGTLERVDDSSRRRSGVVGASIFDGYRKLVPASGPEVDE